MTASAPRRETPPQDREGRTRKAWAAYSDSLRDLDGHDYEDAERQSWERLQRTLRDIEADAPT